MRIRLAIEGRIAQNVMVNVQHFVSAPGVAYPLDTLCQDWELVIMPAYLACLSTSYLITRVVARDLDSLDTSERGLIGTGQLGGESLPFQDAGVITWRSHRAGRSFRGRTFMPAIPEGFSQFGLIEAGLQNLYQNYAEKTMFDVTFAPYFPLHVYSKKLDTMTKVESFYVRDLVYTQRRRRRGKGA